MSNNDNFDLQETISRLSKLGKIKVTHMYKSIGDIEREARENGMQFETWNDKPYSLNEISNTKKKYQEPDDFEGMSFEEAGVEPLVKISLKRSFKSVSFLEKKIIKLIGIKPNFIKVHPDECNFPEIVNPLICFVLSLSPRNKLYLEKKTVTDFIEKVNSEFKENGREVKVFKLRDLPYFMGDFLPHVHDFD